MIDAPIDNPRLTYNQLRSIEEAERRLVSIHEAITNDNKELVVLKEEVIKAKKEREYQEQLLEGTKRELSDLQAEKAKLITDNQVAREELNAITKEAKDLKELTLIKAKNLKDRESDLEVAETSHKQKIEDFNIKTEVLEQDRLMLQKSKDILAQALEQI